MRYEAVIFDWAGTTVDYGCFAPVRAFYETFVSYGIEPTMDEIREPMGMLKIDHIRTMLSMERLTNLWVEKYGKMWTEDDVREVYLKSEQMILDILSDYAEPKPYVLETVAAIRKRGLKIGSTTGYTDQMMNIVVPNAKKAGYAPDCWFSPDSVNQTGRPYPYMIFRNMEALKIKCVSAVLKVGDTISDIREGRNAGVTTVGIIEGSSLMGLSQEEYEALSMEDQKKISDKVCEEYKKAGADYVIQDMRDLLELLK